MRKRPFEICERKHLPQRVRAEIMLRQQGCCGDCGTRLIPRFFVFDHRPPLGLRDKHEEANDPERLAAICLPCHERKTPQDLKQIAKAKRLAESHQDHLERQRHKVPGRPVPSRTQWRQLQGTMLSTPRRQVSSSRNPSFLRLTGPKKQES